VTALDPPPTPDHGGTGARILDRGYRPYEGPRTGRGGAVRALAIHSVQRALGLKRPFGQKILPLLSVLIAYVPAVVFIGLSVLIEDTLLDNQDLIPTYSDYYGFISAAIVVFSAFVAPELLCTDRRTGMLGLYLASPLTRSTYLASKAIAVVSLLALVTLGPPLLLLVAFTFIGKGPDGPGGLARLLAEVLVGGAAVAILHASLSLAVSSTTTRKAAASAGIILILLASAAVSEALLDATGAASELFCLNLLQLPFELVRRIYGDVNTDPTIAAIPTATIVAAYAAWTAAFAGFTWLRYRRIAVDR
jgi:ABC-2 type transport system permease protein